MSSLVDLFSLLDLNKKANEAQEKHGMYDREKSEKLCENDEEREQFLTVIHARN